MYIQCDASHYLIWDLHSLIASSILRVTYGIDIDKESTPYLTIATEAMATFAATFVPGKYFVEVLPILRYIPWWVPGAQFKKDGKAWKPRVQRLTDTPWGACIAALVSRTSSTYLRLLTVV